MDGPGKKKKKETHMHTFEVESLPDLGVYLNLEK